jgi:hypothetical protein
MIFGGFLTLWILHLLLSVLLESRFFASEFVDYRIEITRSGRDSCCQFSTPRRGAPSAAYVLRNFLFPGM